MYCFDLLVFFLFFFVQGYTYKTKTKQNKKPGLRNTLFGIGLVVMSKVNKSKMDKELLKIRDGFAKDLVYKHKIALNAPKYDEIPQNGVCTKELISMLKEWSDYETRMWNGEHKYSSGSVYHGGKELLDLQCNVFKLFCVSNPIHPGTFPFVRKMESEIISMVLKLFHGNYNLSSKNDGNLNCHCGIVTSGGTESIVCAIRAYKNWGRRVKGITKPELIVGHTAHAAFWKACEMFDIKVKVVQVKESNQLEIDPKDVEKYITKNTIAIVGSAPQYANGIIDPIEDLSNLAIKYNIGLHVDCCLGSFQIAFVKEMQSQNDHVNHNYNIPKFDFELPGVTTISCDTHKFGYSTKGTSVLLFKRMDLRHDAYFRHSESSIGWYATPTIAGSRSGGLIAATWAAMINIGQNGYKHDFEQIINATRKIREEIESMDTLEILGNPKLSTLSFRPCDKNIHPFKISDALNERGWELNNCTMPNCCHICITHATYNKADKFLKDLKESYLDVVNNPKKFEKSSGAVYGTMVAIPSTANELICQIGNQYVDATLALY